MSFAAESRERARPVLPLAAMVDILFLLLVFFITASTFKTQEPAIPIQLTPAQSGTTKAGGALATVITITQSNELFIGDRAFDRQGVQDHLKKLYATAPDEKIYIRVDEHADSGALIRIVDDATAAGFAKVDLNVNQLTSDSESP